MGREENLRSIILYNNIQISKYYCYIAILKAKQEEETLAKEV